MVIPLILVAVGSCISLHEAAITCNGMAELCKLNIKEVTLAGSHNAGAGFDGILAYHELIKIPALSCAYRSQEHTITSQLNLGIRYFDIDTCWDEKTKSPWTCHNGAYGGSISKMLSQFDNWMQKNRHDVIVIHFGRDATDANKVAPKIWQQLSEKWNQGGGKLTMQDDTSATLGMSISQNKRIYVIMATKLLWNIAGRKPIISENRVGITWTSKHGAISNDVKELMSLMGEKRCKREATRDFVRYDMYLSWGLCIHDLASLVRPYISEGVKKCYSGTKQFGKTVNFISVDYVDSEVVKVAMAMNKKNIKAVLG